MGGWWDGFTELQLSHPASIAAGLIVGTQHVCDGVGWVFPEPRGACAACMRLGHPVPARVRALLPARQVALPGRRRKGAQLLAAPFAFALHGKTRIHSQNTHDLFSSFIYSYSQSLRAIVSFLLIITSTLPM